MIISERKENKYTQIRRYESVERDAKVDADVTSVTLSSSSQRISWDDALGKGSDKLC